MPSSMPTRKRTDKIRPESAQTDRTRPVSSQGRPVASSQGRPMAMPQVDDLSRLVRNTKAAHNEPASTFAHTSGQAEELQRAKMQTRALIQDVLSREGQKDDLLLKSKKVRRHVVNLSSHVTTFLRGRGCICCNSFVSMCAFMYVCMYACMHVCVCMCVCI